MSTKTQKNSIDSTSPRSSGKNKNATGDNKLYIGFGVAAIVLIVFIFLSSGKDDKKTVKDNPAEKIENVAHQTPQSTGANHARKFKVEDNNINNQTTSNAQVTENSELKMYPDPATGEMFVETPTGALLVSSPEGQKYINDFNNLKAQANNNGSSKQSNSSPQIDQLATITNSQIQALDQKLNDAYDNIENLKALNKKQTETIATLSKQIQEIQPVVKSSQELAKDLFGKQAKKVLASKNNSIQVDSIVGNKAWFTDANGNNVLLAVGDIVPNTSLKVTAIDAATNSVIVKQ